MEYRAVPKIRFSEFREENGYLQRQFEDIFTFSSGKNIKQNEASPEFNTPCVRYGELYHLYGEVITKIVNKTNLNHSELRFSCGNEILLPSAGEDPLDIGSASALTLQNIAIGRTINVLRPKGTIDYSHIYVSFYINGKLKKKISTLARGATISNVYNSDLKNLKINLPPIEEQQKIADFLSSVDKKIALLKEKHDLLAQYKKGVMQKLFSQQIRFKDEAGNDFPDWKEDRLDSFVVKESDPVKVDPDETYREIGVRSHAKGIFHKKPIKGHELGNKRVFWVHPKAFIVNIVFAWEHAVALTSNSEAGFIASHRFPMFVPKEDRVDLRYFTILFKSKRGKHLLGLASPGGAGRNKTLGQSNFAELKLTIPCLEEQARIADFYESLDNKEKLVAQQIEHTQTFKKGLLQQMFV